MANELRFIGKRVKRFDGFDKVTGKAKFVADMALPGMLYAKHVTSPYAHAEILSIDTSEAAALPGVKAVLTYKDILDYPNAYQNKKVLSDKARYVGDQIAAIAATSEEIAIEAVKLVKVEYNPLTPVLEPEEALKASSPEVHAGGIEDVTTPERGDVISAFGQSDVILEGDYTQRWIHPCYTRTQCSELLVG